MTEEDVRKVDAWTGRYGSPSSGRTAARPVLQHQRSGRPRGRRGARRAGGRRIERVCVFGAGAVGGNLAVRLAEGGAEVSVVARGPHLAAIRARGLTLVAGGKRRSVRVAASDDPAALGQQDVVISTLKAPSLPALAACIAPLLGPETPVVFALNGIPWWYFEGLPADGRARPTLAA